ncbi:MAG: hypothetical protein V4706_17185 [Pseudomonadota bacterium]
MRSIVYLLCATLVALPAFHFLVVSFLSMLKVQVPYNGFLSLLFSFGRLVPPMAADLIPRPLIMALGYAMILLVLRRCWLFAVQKERTPVSFVGFQKALGYVGFLFFLLSVLVLLLGMALKADSGIAAGMLMIPAMFCVPWAFFITEITSFKRKAATHAAD